MVSVLGNNRTIHIKDNHSAISYNCNGRLACISVSMLVSGWIGHPVNYKRLDRLAILNLTLGDVNAVLDGLSNKHNTPNAFLLET